MHKELVMNCLTSNFSISFMYKNLSLTSFYEVMKDKYIGREMPS